MCSNRILLLYNGCIRLQEALDPKVIDRVKFIKENLKPPVRDFKVEICDPRTAGTDNPDDFEILRDLLNTSFVYVVLLSNASAPFFEYLKKNALLKQLEESKKLILVSVEDELDKEITRHFTITSYIALIGKIKTSDDNWIKFVNTIEMCLEGSSSVSEESEVSQPCALPEPSAPPVPPSCQAPDDKPPSYDKVFAIKAKEEFPENQESSGNQDFPGNQATPPNEKFSKNWVNQNVSGSSNIILNWFLNFYGDNSGKASLLLRLAFGGVVVLGGIALYKWGPSLKSAIGRFVPSNGPEAADKP